MKLPERKLPTYTLRLPSTNKEYKYRPFTVGEEKLLLLAEELENIEDSLNNIYTVIDACFEDKIKSKDLPYYDFEFLFLKLNIASSGETRTITENCYHEECGYKNVIDINLDNILIEKNDEENKNIIDITDEISVKMKHPTISTSYKSLKSDDPYYLLKNCIEYISDNDTVYNDFTPEELDDWLKKLLDEDIIKLKKFFDTSPKLYIQVEYDCDKCKKKNEFKLKGFENFFTLP